MEERDKKNDDERIKKKLNDEKDEKNRRLRRMM